MKLSLRELILAWITGVVVLFLATYQFFVAPRLDVMDIKGAAAKMASRDLEQKKQIAASGPAWRSKLRDQMAALPGFPAARDPTADLVARIDQIASAHGLLLPRKEPLRKPPHGDLGSLDVKCTWEGNLESLTRFLFALQQDRGMLDVTQLYIKSENKGVLKGTFTITCSFVRTASNGPEGGGAPEESNRSVPTPDSQGSEP